MSRIANRTMDRGSTWQPASAARSGGSSAIGAWHASTPSSHRRPRVDIAGVMVDAETGTSAVERVMDALEAGRGGLMVTVNLDHVRRCQIDRTYRDLVARSELVVADGMPLVWKSRVQGTPLPERVAGSDLVWPLSAACAARGRSVYLLGGDPGAAEAAKAVLEQKFPGLRVCGFMSPERGFEKDEARMAAIERELVASKADLVFVALGSPKQEYVADRLRKALPRAWFVGCGITLSFVAGQVSRAPAWMQRSGLEWAHRLIQEPRRLARRYLIDGLPFAASLMIRAAWRRATGQGRVRNDASRSLLARPGEAAEPS